MRVKRLDLFGFKSFAVKTSIHFEPGVTALVGPNGSGKSNLVDAIRWVLGEHNPRDVRAPRLEDVIFNGTDTKAPLSLAEVSLTIDNDRGALPIAFTEVLITRRVYRSGESEYFINQSPCRLKDIQELFLGTGLGGGTYAIIEQGHIDMILSSKPEERRSVFEEASGVAKYLSKKQETIRRLDEVEQHLTRIADITAEVRRQLAALERQATKARQYKTQWDQLKQWELRLAAHELQQGQHTDEELRQREASLKQVRHAKEAAKQHLLASLEGCNATLANTQAALQDLRTKVVESTSQIEQHTTQQALKSRWIEDIAHQRQQLNQEILQLEQRAAQLAQQLEQVSSQQADVANQLTDIVAQRTHAVEQRAQTEQQLAEALTALEQLKADLFVVASHASQQRNTRSSVTLRLQTLDIQLAKANQQHSALRTKLEGLTQRAQQIEQEGQTLREQLDEIRQQAEAAKQAVSRAQEARQELMGRLGQLREQTFSQRAKTQLLEEIWRRHEGFPEAVKTLLAHRPEGVIGSMADLLEASPGYERALEAALGPLVLAIVVRDRQALRRCQALLAKEQLEGAHLVVLSDCPELRDESEQKPDGQPQGSLGLLQQFVRADPTSARLVEWLVRPWRVIDRIERLLETTPTPQGTWVTQAGDRWDGTSWQVAGSRTGDSIRVGRKQRWEQASAELETLEREMAAAQAAWQQADQQWQTLTAQEGQLRQRAEGLLPALTKLEAQLAQSSHEIRRLHDELKTLDFDQADLRQQQQELQEAERIARQTVEDAEVRQQRLEQTLNERQRQQQEAAQRRQQLDLTLVHVETTSASLAERQETLRSRLDDLRNEQAQLAAQRDAKEAQAQGLTQRANDLTAQLEYHRQQVTILTEARTALTGEVEGVAQRLREEEQQRDQVLPTVLAAEQELLVLMQTLQEVESQLAERSFRRARILERLREIYHLEEDKVLAEQVSVVPLDEAERQALAQQVDRLKAKLEAMGPVSLGSVEEYDALTQRLEFLQTQQQDLTTSRDHLRQSITQINRTARQQFRETFATIQKEFQHYYTRLFGGGEADLILLDEDDVLESGVEIVARPPGKRLQSISLLSGGERALTAIALLFALFKVKPSPFCVLDEIDAPLDEANIDRFTKVLEEFLSLSQFILITHNKKTITKADSLYGVTMEQPGISKIVSVKLTKSQVAAPPPATEPASPVAA